MNHYLNLSNPEHAYMFGFIQTDGNMYESSRNRGKLSIEIQSGDDSILKRFSEIVPYKSSITYRIRNTNFKKGFKAVCFRVCDKNFRDELISCGMTYGNKSEIIKVPNGKYSKYDYFRGIIDGDGSLGLTNNGFPFLSLITKSESLAIEYIKFLSEITGKLKTTSRNKRDSVFNIAIYNEDAQTVVSSLYYDNCLALPRKLETAQKVLAWKRPKNIKKINFERKRWGNEEKEYIVCHTIEESMNYLSRTFKSVKKKLWEINKNDAH